MSLAPITSAERVSKILQDKYHIGAGPTKESFDQVYGSTPTSKMRGDMPKLQRDVVQMADALAGDDRWLVYPHLGPKLTKLYGFLKLVNKRTPPGTEKFVPQDLVDRVRGLAKRALVLKKKHGEGSYADPGADDDDDAPLAKAPSSNRGTKRPSQDEGNSPNKGRVLSGSDGDWRASSAKISEDELFRRAREYIANSGKSSGPEAVAYNAALALKIQKDGLTAQLNAMSGVYDNLADEYDARVAELRTLMADRPSAFPRFTKTGSTSKTKEEVKEPVRKAPSSSKESSNGEKAASTASSSKPVATRSTRSTTAAAKLAEVKGEDTAASAPVDKGKAREVAPESDEDVDMLDDDEPVGNWDDEVTAHERRTSKSEGEEEVSCDEGDVSDIPKGHHSS
ncbi:hypothetical protein DFP72DRAFT_844083 [Ephemerocybe angulata]|uniref:Uncharacterized protein n=1 Tax=Ephemerocybe angulata TaxID=980116 RepID=A0A8H6I8X4_9AGAR|nr:hypothetical protein DFP72DRAFT_844083 [Tulosesus angulatus]